MKNAALVSLRRTTTGAAARNTAGKAQQSSASAMQSDRASLVMVGPYVAAQQSHLARGACGSPFEQRPAPAQHEARVGAKGEHQRREREKKHQVRQKSE